MMVVLKIEGDSSGFAEDKNYAKHLRQEKVLPALAAEDGFVVLDFGKVQSATQSFVHALIGEPLKRYGLKVLDLLEFRNCSTQVKTVIEIVVEYSLGGFSSPPVHMPPHKSKPNTAPAGVAVKKRAQKGKNPRMP